MKLYQLTLAALLLPCAADPSLAGGIANTSQTGSYTLTQVWQANGKTWTTSSRLTESQFNYANESLQAAATYASRRHLSGGCTTGAPAGNSTTVSQSGSGNAAWALQRGTSDRAGIQQAGNQNAAYLLQFGTGQQAQSAQNGDHNVTLIVQTCR